MNSPAYLILLPMVIAPLTLLPGKAVKILALLGYVGLNAYVLFELLAWPPVPVELSLGGWEAPLGIVLQGDALSWLFSGASVLTWAFISLHALVYGEGEEEGALRFFWPLSFMLIGSLQAVYFSRDLFNLYVTLELSTLCAVGLLVVKGGKEVYTAAFDYLVTAYVGSMAYLMGVGLLYLEYGTLDLTLLSASASVDETLYVALALMVFGLAVKTALFPFHFWLPPAHANAWAPVSALLSALVVKGSFLIIIRLLLEFSDFIVWPFLNLMGLMGAGAILYGSLHAVFHPNLKGLIAYSTVSQIGFLFLMLPLMDSQPESTLLALVLFALAHMFAKAGLFLAAGNIIRWHAGKRIDDLKGVSHRSPMAMVAVGLCVFSLAGLPISMGFAGKWTFLGAAFEAGEWWGLFGLFSTLFTMAYLYRIFSHMMEREAGTRSHVSVGDMSRFVAEIIPVSLGALAVGGGFCAFWIARMLGGG